jgi:cytosine/adenosine deaminase-related metal-dependent hydrolase
MKIISANWLLTSDENNSILKNGAVVFDEKILEIDSLENIQKKYPNKQIEILGENSVLMPGLINSHIHLEFSANSTTLKYGNFMNWLNSVIKNRDELIHKATKELMSRNIKKMLKTGTTTIGAISSYSFELETLKQSKINKVFFCEVIGSKPEMIDTLFSDFKNRYNQVKKLASKDLIPAIAIHSPYSVHPFLVREVLNMAKEDKCAVSAHFLESPEEFEWLHKDQGGFLDFFKNFLGQEKAVSKPMEFLNQFSNIENLSFTHCVEASNDDIHKIKDLGAYINHCVTSNRVLNNSKLDLQKIDNVPITIGTDGLSSNNSLSMFDELRNCLMAHVNENIIDLSKKLLFAATSNGARALGLKKGQIKEEYDADMIYFNLPDAIEDKDDLAMNIILHTKFVDKTIIGGEYV